ncbi:hypothetical protein [Chryseobacterium aurantiacum]|uniref:hypothetical protein n=1 Tax=Chryseobacterium aurantiacum TaxID=2116499 RepID=UPI000D132A9A|nr:hypothetical protein [Chryseobacterium aurantiacum]
MSPELRELFEIKEEKKKNNPPARQNVTNHVLIRLVVLIFGTIAFSFAMSEASGWAVLGVAIYMVAFHSLWFLFILIETIVLQSNEKLKLRNANLTLSGILLLIYGIAAIMIFLD